MRKFFTSVALLAFGTASANAGDLSEPVITEVEEPEAAASSTGWWLPLLILAVGVVIASQDDNSTAEPVPGPEPIPNPGD